MSATFGTDGIRGVANSQLSPEVALALGRSAARHLGASAFLVGRDTRQSGLMLQSALSAGIAAEGFDVVDVGVIPTPGLAWLGATRNLPVAMVSASHNPYSDNGIKLFGPGGAKLTASEEHVIERDLEAMTSREDFARLPVPIGDAIGIVSSDGHARTDYLDELVASVTEPLASMRIVCDCANGAASMFAPELFSRLGLDGVFVANTPDGTNINDHCGATAPNLLSQTVLKEGADFGVSFDGDADRLIACDNRGNIIDGDVLLALFAFDLDARGLLANRLIVTTVMSNRGLRRALDARGIVVVETSVGDRNVTDAMDLNGATLGGEQSGHIVFRREALIGDGMYSALRLIELVTRNGADLGELGASAMTRMPQVIHNVIVDDPAQIDGHPRIFSRAESLEPSLGPWGRVLIRASGTEPRVRIMVEGEDVDQVTRVVDELAEIVEQEMALE